MAVAQIKDQVRKLQEDVTTSAHQVFLAGLGAAAIAGDEGEKLFDRLVNRGKKVEAEGKKRLTKVEKQVTETRKKVETRVEKLQGEVDARLQKLVQRLGMPNQEQVAALTDRVAELTRKVEGLQKPSRSTAG